MVDPTVFQQYLTVIDVLLSTGAVGTGVDSALVAAINELVSVLSQKHKQLAEKSIK